MTEKEINKREMKTDKLDHSLPESSVWAYLIHLNIINGRQLTCL